MFANLRVQQGRKSVEVSKLWFEWSGRRQYLGRGIVFEPGGPLDVPDDMINLWRGFGIKPQKGDWPLLRSHILNVLCAGRQDLFGYVIKWMANTVQHPSQPIGVAIALRGAQGAGKGIVARTFGIAHIANGEQLTGRFNASVATSCVVFLDEAFWAGEKKAEGVLKALITEPRLQLEAKFRDPIMVDNHLHIIVASNNDWCVPAGMGDRRWLVLDVADTFAGTGHRDYWDALHTEIENGGAEAMFHDLLNMDLKTFNVRAVPHTAAKAHQQVLSLNGTAAWLHHILQEGCITYQKWEWDADGLTIQTGDAYEDYEAFCKKQHHWRPEVKSVWARKIRKLLGWCVQESKLKLPYEDRRVRAFRFAPLDDCRRQFALRAGAPNMEWEPTNGEPTNEEERRAAAAGQINHDADGPANVATPLDAPTLAPESDAELGLASDGAAGQGSENGSEPPASPAPDREPAQDELDGQWEPVEEEPEVVEWEPVEEELDDAEWEPRDDEADDA
jgi:hypothetical protein